MAFVAAICTQCGAQIKVDDTKEAAICEHCGTAFITEQAVNNYNIKITNNNDFNGATINILSPNMENLLKVGKSALSAGNGKEAYDYANKALEIDSQSAEAWKLKMKSIEYLATVQDSKAAEIISCGKKVIECKGNDFYVYFFFVGQANVLLRKAIEITNDTARVKQLFQAMSVASVFTASQNMLQADSATINLAEKLAVDALLLKTAIPVDFIQEHFPISAGVEKACDNYILYHESLVERLKIYGSHLLDEAIETRRTTLQTFAKGLNEESLAKYSREKIRGNESGGCYIATCVYGSYNCSEVWVLRRYRDDILSRNFLGRKFIKVYYATSPTIVKLFGKNRWFKKIWKIILDRKINRLRDIGIEDTPYIDK